MDDVINMFSDIATSFIKWIKKKFKKSHPIEKELFPDIKLRNKQHLQNVKKVVDLKETLDMQMAKALVKSFQEYPERYKLDNVDNFRGNAKRFKIICGRFISLEITRYGETTPEFPMDYSNIQASLCMMGEGIVDRIHFQEELANFINKGFYCYIQRPAYERYQLEHHQAKVEESQRAQERFERRKPNSGEEDGIH